MRPNIIEVLTEMTNTSSVETLWNRHCERMAHYGFDRLLYGYTMFSSETSLGDPNEFLILSNHARAYLAGFVENGLYRDAPMVNWAMANEGASSWRFVGEKMERGSVSPKALKVIEFNMSHDVTSGYSISFKSVSSRTKAAISLAGKPGLSQDDVDEIWEKFGAEIVLLNNVMHLKILTLPQPMPNQSLTARQRESLEWVGDGKTMYDIATIMGLTQATVEKHLRLARETLNVDTTAQAVTKAAFQNQIYVLKS